MQPKSSFDKTIAVNATRIVLVCFLLVFAAVVLSVVFSRKFVAPVIKNLKAALQSALTKHAALTDDCSAVERLGKEVHLTEGSEENIKITTPVDLAIAEAILQRRGE